MSMKDEMEVKTSEELAKDLEEQLAADPFEENEKKNADEISEEQLDEKLKEEELEEIKEVSEALEEKTDEAVDETSDESAEKETVDELKALDGDDELTDPFEAQAQQTEIQSQQAPAPAKKKKNFIFIPVIIAACLVLGSLIGYFVYLGFFLHEPEGTWEYTVYIDENGAMVEDKKSASDEVTYYYTFNSDGTSVMTIGTIRYNGGFSKTTDENGKKKMTVTQQYGLLSGEYGYEVSGSKLLNNQQLKVLDSEDKELMTLKQSKVKTDLLEKPKDFKADEKLLGDWTYTMPEYGISFNFTFNNDGTATINNMDAYFYDCVYTVSDGTIHLTFFSNKEETQDIEYTCDGTTLKMLDMTFVRPDAATADEAATTAAATAAN